MINNKRKKYKALIEFTKLGEEFNRDEIEHFIYNRIDGYAIDNLEVNAGWISKFIYIGSFASGLLIGGIFAYLLFVNIM